MASAPKMHRPTSSWSCTSCRPTIVYDSLPFELRPPACEDDWRASPVPATLRCSSRGRTSAVCSTPDRLAAGQCGHRVVRVHPRSYLHVPGRLSLCSSGPPYDLPLSITRRAGSMGAVRRLVVRATPTVRSPGSGTCARGDGLEQVYALRPPRTPSPRPSASSSDRVPTRSSVNAGPRADDRR